MKLFCKRGLCLLLTLTLCAGLLTAFSVPAAAYSLEEKQRAVVLTAFAYYDKGHPVQYDSKDLSVVSKGKGGAIRSTHSVAPEDASPDETIYSVCSDFCYQVYYNAFGYKLCGNAVSCWTGKLSKYEPGQDAICAYKYDSQKDSTKREDAITQFLAALQPGDVINSVSTEGNGGHAMLYIGDFLGDGTKYILHCSGYKYNTETGEDTIECSPGMVQEIPGQIKLCSGEHRNNGGISLVSAEEYIRDKYSTSKNRVLSAIRPLNVIKDDENPLTPAARGRLQYPRIVIDRTATGSRFRDVPEGGDVTLTVTLKNYAQQAYTLPVKEVVPDGVTLKKASDGGTVSGKEISWNVALGAGETKTVSYDCAVTAKRGETITFTGGSVGTIPSNTINIPVGGAKLTDAEKKLLAETAEGKHLELFKGAKREEIPAIVWQKLLGLNVPTPTAKGLMQDVIGKTVFAGEPVYLPKDGLQGAALDFRNMLVPEFCGGFYCGVMDSLRRVLDLRCDYLEPGDIVIEIEKINSPSYGQTLVYLGNEKFLRGSKDGAVVVGKFELQKAHIYELFYALRPTLAYDDVHKLAELPKESAFTDVKESDWFYTYVKDLVADGTVSGMTETTFVPNGNLTYGQALKLITLAVGEKEQAKTGAHWASGYLTLAKSKGWIGEDVDLDGKITRLQFCRIAAKAKGLSGKPTFNPFMDTSDPAVLALYQAGVVSGVTASEFRPDGLLTRAQIAKIIWTMRQPK